MTKTKLTDLKPDTELRGTVTRTELYGAFVDVGAEVEGMVHISQLRKGNVRRVEDVVQPGQEVSVWVHKVDPQAKRLELGMVPPLDLKWKDIKPGMQLIGKVVRIESFGAFVELGAERPGLVHVSELSNEYVKHPSDIVSKDQEVEVRVLDVDQKKRRIRLTMKEEISEEVYEEEEQDEPLATAMEVALRKAMDESEGDQSSKTTNGAAGKKGHREDQEDLLSRTLEQRMKSSSSGRE